MEQLFSQWGPASPQFWVRGLWALALFVIFLWIAALGRGGTRQALRRARAHPNAMLLWGRLTHLVILVIGLILVLAVLGVEWSALAALVGLLAVAASLSFQDIARSLLAGLYLLVEHPFNVGDTVEVSGEQGVIVDVGMRTTILRSPEGDRIIIPNLVLFTSVIVQKNMASERTASSASEKDQT